MMLLGFVCGILDIEAGDPARNGERFGATDAKLNMGISIVNLT